MRIVASQPALAADITGAWVRNHTPDLGVFKGRTSRASYLCYKAQ
jgi:hypothetical protein